MLNLNLLRIFHTVAKHRNVNSAAELLFISQPAVSNGLKRFQEEIELELFEKKGRHLVLTPVGEALYELTAQLFNTENDIEQFFSEIKNKRSGVIRLGLATLYERYAMVDLMSKFDTSNSNITISVTSGNSRKLIKRLRANKVDIAIAGDIDVDKNMMKKFLKKHQIFLVAPKGHRLYGRKFFELEDLTGESMVLKEEGSSVRRMVDMYLAENDVTFSTTAELSNLDSILEVTIKEECLTFLPDLACCQIQSHNFPFSISSPVNGEISFSIFMVTLKEDDYPRWLWRKIQDFAQNFCDNDINFS